MVTSPVDIVELAKQKKETERAQHGEPTIEESKTEESLQPMHSIKPIDVGKERMSLENYIRFINNYEGGILCSSMLLLGALAAVILPEHTKDLDLFRQDLLIFLANSNHIYVSLTNLENRLKNAAFNKKINQPND